MKLKKENLHFNLLKKSCILNLRKTYEHKSEKKMFILFEHFQRIDILSFELAHLEELFERDKVLKVSTPTILLT